MLNSKLTDNPAGIVIPNLDQCVIESVGSKTTNFEPLALLTSNKDFGSVRPKPGFGIGN